MQTDGYVFPSLETERLLLQPLTTQFTDFIFQHFSSSAVTRYLLDEPPMTNYAEAEELVQFYLESQGKTYNRWIIIQKSDNQPVGTCGYHKWHRRNFRAEIGYDLHPGFWGQAYMREALNAVLDIGFEEMGLNRIEALVSIENDRSIRLLHRLGFKQEGLFRDYYYFDTKFYDHYVFSLLRREWKQ